MNKFFYILLMFISSATISEPLIVFENTIEITEKCQIKSTNTNNEVTYTHLSLPSLPNCNFIKYDETNLIHMEQIANSYLFLVESTSESKNRCVSHHTAIAINSNGEVLSADFSKKSLSCNIDREPKLFKYFAHKMKIID